MAFTSKQERKFGAINIQTKHEIGPGSYLGTNSTILAKKRISVKEPFASMVDRDGKNTQSWNNLHGLSSINSNALLPPYHEQIVQKNTRQNMMAKADNAYVPGPGHYEIGVGFGKISSRMQQIEELKQSGLDIPVVNNTTSFKGLKDRFKDPLFEKKSQLPGPGTYDQRQPLYFDRQRYSRPNTQLVASRSCNSLQSRGQLLNPPSIPSHMNIFGYDEDTKGQLVKQQAQMVGFTGIGTDRVGPGDYEVAPSEVVVRKNVVGVTQWKKPEDQPELIQSIQNMKKKAPGPGDYEDKQVQLSVKDVQRGSSSFKSNVQRAQTAGTLSRLQLRSIKKQQKHIGRGFSKSAQENRNRRPETQLDKFTKTFEPECELDTYEGDENEDVTPGPGHYNPQQPVYSKLPEHSEKLQFFGSTVERFAEDSRHANNEIGPCSYDISNKLEKQRLVNPTIYSGFSSAANRFGGEKILEEHPGPGYYYDQTSMTQLLQSKVQSKKPAIFGSMQPRFPVLRQKDVKPGPSSEYPKNYNDRSRKRQFNKNFRDPANRSYSLYQLRQEQQMPTAQSYIQQNEQAVREASKNYLNQIQYDARSNTIANRVKQKSTSVLLKAKKQRGPGGIPKQPLAFGTRQLQNGSRL